MDKKIEIPKEFMGVPVSEDTLKETLERDPIPAPVPVTPAVGTPTNTNKPDYLLLQGRQHGDYEYPDLLVATERTHQNKNWQQSWDALKGEDAFMLTMRQYVDFLNMLRSGQGFDKNGRAVGSDVLTEILNDIVEVRSPWRSEWLDAKFNTKRTGKMALVMPVNEMHVTYHVLDSGTLREVTEPLEAYLEGDKSPGIDLYSWLDNATKQGLPNLSTTIDTGKSGVYYWDPKNNAVARFDADSDRAVLDCDGDPIDSYSSLGVRVARAKN